MSMINIMEGVKPNKTHMATKFVIKPKQSNTIPHRTSTDQ